MYNNNVFPLLRLFLFVYKATLDVLVRIIEPRKAGPLGREVEKSGCLRVMTYAGDKWEELLPILNGSDIVVMNALDEIQCITPGNAPFVAADINGDKLYVENDKKK